MLNIKEVIVVEGKYDKMALKEIVKTTIVETNGFRIFRDKEKANMIRLLAEKNGILVLTDSDSAGFLIRNHLRGIVSKEKIKHAYIPRVKGKEKRKEKASKEGILGVEGIDKELLKAAIENAGVVVYSDNKPNKIKIDSKLGSNNNSKTDQGRQEQITKSDFYKLGLTGRDESKILRTKLLNYLGLPAYLTTNAMIDALNNFLTLSELCKILVKIQKGH